VNFQFDNLVELLTDSMSNTPEHSIADKVSGCEWYLYNECKYHHAGVQSIMSEKDLVNMVNECLKLYKLSPVYLPELLNEVVKNHEFWDSIKDTDYPSYSDVIKCLTKLATPYKTIPSSNRTDVADIIEL
jgi:hypothetical protein